MRLSILSADPKKVFLRLHVGYLESQKRGSGMRKITTVPCLTAISARLTDGCIKMLRLVLIVMPLLLANESRAFAQAQNTGSIYGSVTDPSGAVIPGATVTVAESSKGVNRAITSSKSGEFVLPDLPIGTYILTVSASGFETFVASSITVDADRSVKITAKMTVGSAKDTVNVDGEGTALDTRSATIGTLIPTNLVENLPIDGNNVVALAGLLPGVTDLNAPATNTSDRGGPTFSVSGSRNTQNLMLFDGLMWNNLFYNTGINYPPPNALQEISVLLNNFKAQYGRNAGSVFNVLTKSGSNQFHGAVWDYFQNRMFNASDYISHENPEDNSNQFGGTLGGPIKHDKAYFFVAVQQLKQTLQVVGITPIQGAAERGFNNDGVTPRPCITPAYPTGTDCASFVSEVLENNTTPTTTDPFSTTYSKLLNPELISSGTNATPGNAEDNFNAAWQQAGNTGTSPCIALLDQVATYAANNQYFNTGKAQGTYLPNAEIPTQCLNPVIAGVLKKYVPLPNAIEKSSLYSGGIPGLVDATKQPRRDLNLLGRVDYHLNDRHTIDARYDLIHANDATAPGVNSASQGISSYEIDNNLSNSNFGNIADTWVVTPNILNVLRVGYKRYTYHTPPSDPTTLNSFGGNFVEIGPPVMPVIGASNEYNLGSTSQALSNVVNENIEVLEQLSWQKGNHSFQFGANFLRLQYLNNSYYPGELSFSSTYTGVSFADEATGLLNSVQANNLLTQGGVSHSIFTYAQDDWRITPKLTLNLGVRYELPFQWYQPNGYASTFIPGYQSTVFPGAIGGLAYPGDKGVLKSLVPTDFNGIVPRFGFAYDTSGNGRLVLRGGFGMFFDAVNANVIGVGEPFYFTYYQTLPAGGASVPLQQNPGGPIYQLPPAYQKGNPLFRAPYTLFFPDRNFRTPYYESINLGFELRVNRNGVLDTNYVGKLGRKLTIPFDQNPAITQCVGSYASSNPALYQSPSCPYLFPGSLGGNASSQPASTQARLRYTPFNYGGGGLVDFASIGTSNYNGLQVQYTQRGGKLLTILLSYTYSKSIDLQTQSESVTNSIPDVFDVSSERGLSDYDARHVLNTGWILTVPKVHTESSIANTVLNNWLFGGKFSAHSGKPYSVTINNDSALDGEPNQRASLIPGANPNLPKNRHRTAKITEWFNINAFTYPTIGTFSNVPRNAFIGPGYLDTDMNIGRYFPIRQGVRLLFRADAFNIWNTPNLAPPQAKFSCTTTSIQTEGSASFGMPCNSVAGNSTASTFGTIQSTFGNNGNTSTNGRKMQFSATLYF